MIRSAVAASGAEPSLEITFKPFHCPGLWLAVTVSPASALRCTTITPIVGVIATPTSTTRHPHAASASPAMPRNSSPPRRPSHPSTTVGLAAPHSSFNHDTAAPTNRRTTSCVRLSPTIPRHPLTESMRGAKAPMAEMIWRADAGSDGKRDQGRAFAFSMGCPGLAVCGKAGTNLQPRPASLQSRRDRGNHDNAIARGTKGGAGASPEALSTIAPRIPAAERQKQLAPGVDRAERFVSTPQSPRKQAAAR